MTYPLITPFKDYSLPHPVHEWMEIVVGSEGGIFWVGGVHSPEGFRRLRVDIEHIASCPTAEEAIQLGKSIAEDASRARALLAIPRGCAFTSEL